MLLAIAHSFFGSPVPLQGQVQHEPTEVAITFDDLPSHGPLPAHTTRADVATSIIKTLKGKDVPGVYGFINARRLKDDPRNAEVLRLWVDAGFQLGNHTYAHIDLNSSDLQTFENDIAANEPILESFIGLRDWHWFRYPFAHEGETLEKRRAVRAYLSERGYRIAHITLDFNDYAWNGPYTRCLAQGDDQAIAWLKSSYLSAAAECMSRGQTLSHGLYGRDIKHVLLLHIGAFESVMLPALLDQITQLGFRFVSLNDAEKDPGYQEDPDIPLANGRTFLDQVSAARHLTSPPRKGIPLEKLDAVCR